MNRSRIRRLQRRAMPEQDMGLQVSVLHLRCHDGKYYHEDDPDHAFTSENEAIDDWKSRAEERSRSTTLLIVRWDSEKWGPFSRPHGELGSRNRHAPERSQK